MTDTPQLCQCSFQLVIQIVNSVILLLVLVTQGSILDYYLIQHNGGTSGWYFWFFADFMVLIAFMASIVISYRYYKKKAKNKNTLSIGYSKQAQKPLPKIGALPLGFIVWTFYACLLVVKIVLLFKMEIAQKLDEKTTFGPQLLKVVIGMSSVVFFLLVESHHDAAPQSDRLSYLHLLISTTAFELFDSITFLSILLPNDSHVLLPWSLEDAVLALACANFFLPGLALYKLSQSEFGKRPRSLGLSLLYKGLHLLLINVPYLVIRLYLWTAFGRDISLFLMKNVLSIFALILTSLPDIRYWWFIVKEEKVKAKHDNDSLELNVICSGAEAGDAADQGKNVDELDDIHLQCGSGKVEFNSRL